MYFFFVILSPLVALALNLKVNALEVLKFCDIKCS